MNIAIMQPYFFPYIGYWQLISCVDIYVVYDDVNYIKNGWINRNNILINGQKQLVTLHLEGASSNALINEVMISKVNKHKIKILKTIEQSYKKAPYFDDVFPIINDIISNDNFLISEFLFTMILKVNAYLGINTKIMKSSEIEKNNQLKAVDKVIHLCRILQASHYINAMGGRELYDHDRFNAENIDLSFLFPQKICYKQFNTSFVENLSIIDVLMFNSINEINQMLSRYDLVA